LVVGWRVAGEPRVLFASLAEALRDEGVAVLDRGSRALRGVLGGATHLLVLSASLQRHRPVTLRAQLVVEAATS